MNKGKEFTVIKYSDDYKERWKKFWSEKHQCSLYHSIPWLEFSCHIFKCENESVICLKSNGDIIGILPLLSKTKGKGKYFVSAPFRDRGGIVAKTEEIGKVLFEKFLEILSPKDKFLIKIIDDNEKKYYPDVFCFNSGKIRSILNINKDLNEIWSGISPKARNHYRKGEKKGLMFKRLNVEEHVLEFEKLLLKTRKNIGTLTYPQNYFSKMYHYLGDNFMKLFSVSNNGEVLAMVVAHTYKESIVYAYAVYNFQFVNKYSLNDFMVWNIIKWGVENNFKIVDFAADRKKNKGVIDFKKKYADKQLECYSIRNFDIDETSIKFENTIKLFVKFIPTSLLQKMSNLIVPRYFI